MMLVILSEAKDLLRFELTTVLPHIYSYYNYNMAPGKRQHSGGR